MFCNKCGSEIPADSKFCVKCGTRIETIQSVNEAATQTSTNSRTGSDKAQKAFTVCVISVIAAVVLFIIAVVGSVLMLYPFVVLAYGAALISFKILRRLPDSEKTEGQKLFIKVSHIIMLIIIVIALIKILNE